MPAVAALLAVSTSPAKGRAQWQSDGLPICTDPRNQEYPFIVADGAGGAFIAWRDLRDSVPNGYDLYMQHIDALGEAQWALGGIPIITETGDQVTPQLTRDGAGGVIAAWSDFRNGAFSDVYAQRFDSAGQPLWALGGVRLRNSTNDKFLNVPTRPTIAADGLGGAIIAWDEELTGFNSDVYAQRISAGGALRWSAAGKAVSRAPSFQTYPALVSDGQSGAYIVWEDWRETPQAHVYAQLLDSTGSPAWSMDGVLVSAVSGNDLRPAVVSDERGGSIVSWNSNGSDANVYTQRLARDGVRWDPAGVDVCTATGRQEYPNVAPDGSGGALISWLDLRSNPGCLGGCQSDVYTQRIDSTGSALWEENGIPVCRAQADQGPAVSISDGAGGAIVIWADYRTDGAQGVYAQHLDAAGLPQWQSDGIRVDQHASQRFSPVVATDGFGGAIITWSDNREGSQDENGQPWNLDIYAARLTEHGTVDAPPVDLVAFSLLEPEPSPMSVRTRIEFSVESPRVLRLEILDVCGHRVRVLADWVQYGSGRHEVIWNGRSDGGQFVRSGVYFIRLADRRQSRVRRVVVLR